MMNLAKSAGPLIYALFPAAVVVFAGFAWDEDFKLIIPVVLAATILVGLVAYVRNPDGRWWLIALIGGIAGIVLGVAGLFYVASQI